MFEYRWENVWIWGLAFVRIGAILFALPIFGDEPVSVRIRVLLSVAICLAVIPTLPGDWILNQPRDLIEYMVIIGQEVILGVLIGFVAKIIFEGLVAAASVCGYQMGFGTASMMMAGVDEQVDGFTALHRVLVVLIFFSLNLHHLFFEAIVQTFQLVKPGHLHIGRDVGEYLLKSTAGIFAIALQLAAPVLIALSFTMAALGLVARTVPEFNVFTASFPVSFFVGLTVYLACLPFFPGWMSDQVMVVRDGLQGMIRGIGG
jgi:flagellar biosynthetic protein FliR